MSTSISRRRRFRCCNCSIYIPPRATDEEKPRVDSWVLVPVLKMVAAFEDSTKLHPLIAIGKPEPYMRNEPFAY
jgi:hypothetical protein